MSSCADVRSLASAAAQKPLVRNNGRMTVNADSQRVGPGAGVDSERRDVESLSPKHSAHTTVVPIPDEETPLISENGTAVPASTEPQWLGGLTTKRFQLLFLQRREACENGIHNKATGLFNATSAKLLINQSAQKCNSRRSP